MPRTERNPRFSRLSRQGRAMLELLKEALYHIRTELDAAGDELDHPVLKDKIRFMDRAKKQIAKWERL